MGATIWVHGEVAPDGSLARGSAEVATLARQLAAAAGVEAAGVVVAGDPGPAAEELARYVARVVAIAEPRLDHETASIVAAHRIAALVRERGGAYVLTGGGEGRDVAGTLSVLLGWGVLANASAVTWGEAGPLVESVAFGGRLVTESEFTGGQGVITVRANAVQAAPDGQGLVEVDTASEPVAVPAVRVVERVESAAGAASIDDARVVVTAGRGVSGESGIGLVRELADALGGAAVGATRAAVDSGWLPYALQIGQTGKVVKPELYVGLGVSGAIQHRVGMQGSSTIVAINRDPDAPLATYADLFVVGDVFEVVPEVVARLSRD